MVLRKHCKEYIRLKKYLMENLEARGLSGEVYRDKVDEYMDLWERRKQLRDKIEELGVTINSASGTVENRMVSLELQVCKQMLAIYTALGFKNAVQNRAVSEDDDTDL